MVTLEWSGKKSVINHHVEVPYHLLRREPVLSVGDVDTGNLLIQGDNCDAVIRRLIDGSRLRRERITFRQISYEIQGR